jgi:hypothetical protein
MLLTTYLPSPKFRMMGQAFSRALVFWHTGIKGRVVDSEEPLEKCGSLISP